MNLTKILSLSLISMRAVSLGLALGMMTTLSPAAENEEAILLVPAQELRVRQNLPHFFQKAQSTPEVKIAYLGGSITAAPGWRVFSREWFQGEFPKTKFQEINAAIGGTGSDLGVFRLGEDVLKHDPDLIFVEFAVNDGGADPENIYRWMEGIVRQVWTKNPEIDICFVYTFAQNTLKDIQSGHFQRSASAMEKIAEHYGIPSIHFGLEVAALEKEGKLIFTGTQEDVERKEKIVFSTDGVHPLTETGHRLYQKAIERSFTQMKAELPASKPKAHHLGEPFRADHWAAAKMIPIRTSMLKGAWTQLSPENHSVAKSFHNRMPVLWKAEAGASLQFKFKGKVASVYDLVGPDGGKLKIEVDGKVASDLARIDGYCTYHRLAKSMLISTQNDEEHVVSVTLSDEKLDKRSILFESNRQDLDAKPEKYEGHTWYAGSLLILGELIEE